MTEAPQVASAGPGGLDWSREADVVVQRINAARGRVVVLCGKASAGKTEFVSSYLLRKLGAAAEYADCTAGLPATVGSGGTQLEEALKSAKVLLLDGFDRMLRSPEKPTKDVLANLFRKAKARATLVLVTSEKHLGEVLSLSRYSPGILDNLVEVSAPTLSAAVQGYVPPEGGLPLQYEPEVLQRLEKELADSSDEGPGPLLVSIVDKAFRRQVGPDVVVRPANLDEAQGLAGILEDHLDEVWERAGQDLSGVAPPVGQAVLERVAQSEGQSVALDLSGIAERLDVADDAPGKCVAWLANTAGVLRHLGDGRYEIVPPQLRHVVDARREQEQATSRPAARLLAEGMRARQALGSLLPLERFGDVHEKRTFLRAGTEEAAFLLLCALRHARSGDDRPAAYWLRRIPDEDVRVATLIEALYDAQGGRQHAARLLRGVDRPEVQAELYRVALEDDDKAVRRTAGESLASLHSERIRDLLEQEAGHASSRFRRRAIAAMWTYGDERCAQFLRRLVDDRASAPEVRRTAIHTLKETNSPPAVEALVDIALNDADAEDRKAATELLEQLPTDALAAHALAHAKQAPLPRLARGMGAVKLAASALASLVAVVWSPFLHGLVLIVLGPRALGLGFLLVEVIALGLMNTFASGTGWVLAAIASALYFGNTAVSVVAAAWLTQRDRERSRAEAGPLRRVMTSAAVVFNVLVVGALVHGIGHLLLRRKLRGLMLLGLEALGTGFMTLSLGYPHLFDTGAGAGLQRVSDFMREAYKYGGIALFVGTYLWDVVAVLKSEILEFGRGSESARRQPALRAILSGPHGAAGVLKRLRAPGDPEAKWAKRLLKSFKPPVSQLSAHVLREQGEVSHAVLRCLARRKDDGVVQALGDAWESASERQRRNILSVLRQYPTEASLRCLDQRRRGAGWQSHVRYKLARWHFRFRVWPRAVIVTATAVTPLALLLMFEAVATARNPARTQIKEFRRDARGTMTDAARATARFLAERYPNESAGELAAALSTSHATHWPGLAESLGTIVLKDAPKARATALEALVGAARDGGETRRQEVAWKALEHSAPGITDEAFVDHAVGLLEDRQLSDALRLRAAVLLRTAGPEESPLRMRGRQELSKRIPWFESILVQSPDAAAKTAAIHAIVDAGDDEAVAALKRFILSTSTPAPNVARDRAGASGLPRESLEVAERQGKFRLGAIKPLREIGTTAAQQALVDLSRDPHALPAIQGEALRQLNLLDPLADVRVAFDNADYRTALAIGRRKLRAGLEPAMRARLLSYLGESSLRLAYIEPRTTQDHAKDAVRYLDEAQKIAPVDRPMLLNEALQARAQGLHIARQLPEARVVAARAVKMDANNAGAHGTLAAILYDLDRPQQALIHLERATSLNPSFSWAWCMQAIIHGRANSPEGYRRAEAAALQAQQADPRYWYPYAILSDLDVRQKRQELAVQRLESFRERHPDVEAIYGQLAYVYHEHISKLDRERGYRRAYEASEQLLGLSGASSDGRESAQGNLVESSFTIGRYEETLKRAKEQLKRQQSPAKKLVMLTFTYAAQVLTKDRAAARDTLQEIAAQQASVEPGRPWIFDGTLWYLEGLEPQTDSLRALRRTFEALNVDMQDGQPRIPADVLEANRTALAAEGP